MTRIIPTPELAQGDGDDNDFYGAHIFALELYANGTDPALVYSGEDEVRRFAPTEVARFAGRSSLLPHNQVALFTAEAPPSNYLG